MDQLREISGGSQASGETRRRWFTCDDMDLIVRESASGEVVGFQLYYDKHHRERAVLWRAGGELQHMGVDDGEHRPMGHKAAPILVPDGILDADAVREQFLVRAGKLPDAVVEVVRQHLCREKREAE